MLEGADAYSLERYKEETCNAETCLKPLPDSPIPCRGQIGVILVLDGSHSTGETGWTSTKDFATKFVSAFKDTADAAMSVISFSGPKTYWAWYHCMRAHAPTADSTFMEKTCGIKVVQHLETNMDTVTTAIGGMEFLGATGGTTLTSQALAIARSEVTLSRQGMPTVVTGQTETLIDQVSRSYQRD